MKIHWAKWLFLPPVILGLGTVIFLGTSKKELSRVEASEQAIPLDVRKISRQSVAAEVTGFGTAQPAQIWSAVAEVSGRVTIKHPNLKSGVLVEPDTDLLIIDTVDYQLQANQRSADLAQAQAELKRLKLNEHADRQLLVTQKELLAVRQKEVDRLQNLEGKNTTSQSEYDSAQAAKLQQQITVLNLETTLETYPAQYDVAQAKIDLADARLAEATRNLKRTRIAAPFRGLLSGVTLTNDQYVTPNQQLFQVYDTETIEIEAEFSLAQLNQVASQNRWQGQPSPHKETVSDTTLIQALKVSESPIPPASLQETFSARVLVRSGEVVLEYPAVPVRVREALDQQTRTLGIVMQVRALSAGDAMPLFALRPGSYCEIVLKNKNPIEAFLIPRSSVQENRVYVLNADNVVESKPVQIAFPAGEHYAVTQGLQSGDIVVVNPPAVVLEGKLAAPQFPQ